MEWKDVSSYRQREQDRTPNTFHADAGGIRISVHRHIHYKPTDWLLTAQPWFNCTVLKSISADGAKLEAGYNVREKIKAALEATAVHQAE